jgi:hypothetical protein
MSIKALKGYLTHYIAKNPAIAFIDIVQFPSWREILIVVENMPMSQVPRSKGIFSTIMPFVSAHLYIPAESLFCQSLQLVFTRCFGLLRRHVLSLSDRYFDL